MCCEKNQCVALVDDWAIDTVSPKQIRWQLLDHPIKPLEFAQFRAEGRPTMCSSFYDKDEGTFTIYSCPAKKIVLGIHQQNKRVCVQQFFTDKIIDWYENETQFTSSKDLYETFCSFDFFNSFLNNSSNTVISKPQNTAPSALQNSVNQEEDSAPIELFGDIYYVESTESNADNSRLSKGIFKTADQKKTLKVSFLASPMTETNKQELLANLKKNFTKYPQKITVCEQTPIAFEVNTPAGLYTYLLGVETISQITETPVKNLDIPRLQKRRKSFCD